MSDNSGINGSQTLVPSPQEVVELAVNLDDVTGQVLGAIRQELLDAGALDVWTTSIDMKKDRPGVCLSLICSNQDCDMFARRVLKLTGSFGLRFRQWQRLVLERRYDTIQTIYGQLRLKVGTLPGDDLVVARPEFEDVRQLAQRHGVSIGEMMSAAESAAGQWLAKNTGQNRQGGA